MKKEIIDIIWHEETKRFGLENENIYWRHGYPRIDGIIEARSYVDYYPENMRVTIDDTLKTPLAFRRDIRHELHHAFCHKNGIKNSELDARFAEFFPDIQLWYLKRILKKRKQFS